MIRDSQMLRDFEDELVSRVPVNVKQNFAIANSLLNEALALGVLPLPDALDGLDGKIEFVRTLNAL